MRCVCGSDVLLHIGGKTYCAGCYDAGMRFGKENAEKVAHVDDELDKIRAEIEEELRDTR